MITFMFTPDMRVFATLVPNAKAATKLRKPPRLQPDPASVHDRDDGSNRVCRVVKPVDVIEGQGDQDDNDDQKKRQIHAAVSCS